MEDLSQSDGSPDLDSSTNQSNNNSQQTEENASSDPQGSHNDSSQNDSSTGVDDENEEPEERKSKLQYILERKERKLQKLEQERHQNSQNNEESDDDDDLEDNLEDEEFSPEEAAKFDRYVEKKFGKKLELVDKLAERTEVDDVNAEIANFIKTHEHGNLLAEHEEKIRKWALHPSRSKIPIKEIIFGILGEKKLIAYGAEQAIKAMKDANESQNGGSSARRLDGNQEKSWLTESKDSFEAEKQRVLRG